MKMSSVCIGHLNIEQKMFIEKISRYVSLFTVAMLVTLFTAISILIAQSIPGLFTGRFVYLMVMSAAWDSTFNVCCLVLQYSFATSFYYKYFAWIECCWKRLFTKRAEKDLKKEVRLQLSVNSVLSDED